MFARQNIEQVTPIDASDRFFMAQLVLVDVRTDSEFEEVRVPGSIHIPMGQIRGRLDELTLEHPVAFICQSGHRSNRAARAAARRRDDVMNVAGGIRAWLDAGLPAATCPVSHDHERRTT
ncbi:MAG: rhodanese-like domain-containing protein [Solirubrobacterales bacterium]